MKHLHPFELVFNLAGASVTVRFEFGLHCFTDDKGNGEIISFRGERRYFCMDRYQCSTQLRDYIERRFFDGVAVPYFVKNNQRYFCLDLHDYAIFFSISKPRDLTNTLKLRIISAYDVATWGRHSLPRGKPHKVRYILEMRNAGKTV